MPYTKRLLGKLEKMINYPIRIEPLLNGAWLDELNNSYLHWFYYKFVTVAQKSIDSERFTENKIYCLFEPCVDKTWSRCIQFDRVVILMYIGRQRIAARAFRRFEHEWCQTLLLSWTLKLLTVIDGASLGLFPGKLIPIDGVSPWLLAEVPKLIPIDGVSPWLLAGMPKLIPIDGTLPWLLAGMPELIPIDGVSPWLLAGMLKLIPIDGVSPWLLAGMLKLIPIDGVSPWLLAGMLKLIPIDGVSPWLLLGLLKLLTVIDGVSPWLLAGMPKLPPIDGVSPRLPKLLADDASPLFSWTLSVDDKEAESSVFSVLLQLPSHSTCSSVP